MASSMLTGDRRWASSRRGGMTVLGKVAVPKPINLPSQRLENHGQNRDVEIVPKGTLSWGSKQPSSSLNAWGVPNNDGGTSSPGQLSGRPSSGGSGTRPSTAGSDFTHEHNTNAWAPNSRPSSASASLASNQSSLVSLRPHSAETRLGSSQLSRFAEPVSDNPAAWVAAGTADQLGGFSSKNERFSLSSRDFPTLGLEKETSGRNIEHQERGPQGRPGSSAGVASRKEDIQNTEGDFSFQANMNSGDANSWRRENAHYTDNGARPAADKWHAEPQPYPNSSIPHQHYDTWRGPPLNSHPGGVWYRGPPGGPPFGLPVPPGGFPMEPFPYYRPQVHSPAMENLQPVPPPGTGPRGPHPRNGDMYRPHVHDAYFRPGMPIRPGFYPGPIPYDGYYGPPMGYMNSNERDLQSMAMAVEPSAYNRFTGAHAPDIGNSHSRSGGYGPSGKTMVLEQMEPGHNQEAQGQVLKQYDREDKDKQQRREDNMTTYHSHPEKGDHHRDFSRGGSWRVDLIKDQEMGGGKVAIVGGGSLGVSDHREFPVRPKSIESIGHYRELDYNSLGRLNNEDHKSSALSEVSAVPEDPSLIQKIEGLNAKVRATDGGRNVNFLSRGEEQKNKVQVSDTKVDPSVNGGGSVPVALERIQKEHISVRDRIVESKGSASGISRKPAQGMHGRTDHRGKGRITTLEADGTREISLASGSAGVVAAVHPEHSVVGIGQDCISAKAIEKSASLPLVNDEGEHMPPTTDSGDSHSQRPKMIELAKQRLKQREKEEEERARDQKVKALAKLEELNRRTQAVEGSKQKLETVSSTAIQNKQEECLAYSPANVVALNAKGQGLVLGPKPKALMLGSESNVNSVEKSASWSGEGLLETPKTARKDPLVHGQSETMSKHVNVSDPPHNNGSQVHDSGASKQKVTGNMKKQSIPLETKLTESLKISSEVLRTRTVADNATVYFGGVPVEISSHCESSSPVNSSVMTEPSVEHRKNNRSGMSKQKLKETSSKAVFASSVSEDKSASKGTTPQESVADRGKSNTSESILDLASAQPHTDLTERSMELPTKFPNEDAHHKANNQWKSQHSRRMARNPPVNRSVEKLHSGDSVVWAPVRSQNKTESTDEVAHKAVVEAPSSVKSDQPVQHNPRNKRAEMERYIPKPAAKEASQQGSSHQTAAPSIIQGMPYENMHKCESGSLCTESSQTSFTTTTKVVSAGESKNGDGKRSKPGKANGSWRRRGSAELTSSFPSVQSKNDQLTVDQSEPQKLDVISEKEQSQPFDDWNISYGWTMPENFVATVTVSVPKDQGVAAREKRHPFKGQRGTGYNRDSDDKKINSGEVGKNHSQTSAPEMHEGESSAHSKEKRAVGDQSISHWQPKSQPPEANQRGISLTGSQNVVDEVGQGNRNDTCPKELGAQLPPQPEKENVLDEPSLSNEVLTGHHETKWERKTGSHKSRLRRPGESSSASDMDNQNDQQMASGFHKHANQNSRSVRELEPHGDWSESGKDYKQYSVPVNRDRHRHNSHYEYQPIGPHNSSKTNMEPPKGGSHNYHSRFRERSQSHTRHGPGHYYGRQTGTAQVDAND